MENSALSSTTIQRLLLPEVYPHPVRELTLLETHISWVILTGDFAYKIKKPCKFDFVDYSTRERRHGYCIEELALNRRLAADLYLDVVPIFADSQGLWRVGDGSRSLPDGVTLLDHAVKMKQFPQSAILSQRVTDHRLTAEAIDQFGIDLARFHDTIEPAPSHLDCIRTHHIRQDAVDNLVALQNAFLPASELSRLLDALRDWTEAEFVRRETVFNDRLDRGAVRRCHGDMHLNNLIQLDDRVTAFDCIEFNEEFQWIDVMSDLAFPVMDFAAWGRMDLGARLLNSYLESRDDWRGMKVFRFYAVYRAMVRAKVTWLDPSKHPLRRGENGTMREAGPWEGYIRTAFGWAFPPAVRLAITHGLSGSGKSTKALAYVSKHNALRLRSDVERNRLEGVEDRDRYSTASRDRVYQHLLERAESLLSLQHSVVVDATFLKRQHRRDFESLAAKLGVQFEILVCDASFEELERRIRLRTDDPSEATLAVLQRQIAEVEPLTFAERQYVDGR